MGPGPPVNLYTPLTAHNWQKWKSTFLTCPCHEICRVEAVGLNNSNYTWKITISEYVKFGAISWKCDILSITARSKLKSKSPFAHVCDTHDCGYLPHTILLFPLNKKCFINFQLNTDFPSIFAFFTVKSCNVTQRSVSQENTFFFSQNYRLI